MAITGVRVFLHNETNQALALLSSEVPDGDWTVTPPARIEAWSVAAMGSESSTLNPDTEGRATYQIGEVNTETVYIHWNDPAIGSNSFHTNTDDGHYACWSASSGHHPEVHFTVRAAGTVMTDFLPSRDGFKFGNHWEETPYSLPPLRGSVLDLKYGNAKNGLCGGIVFAALDYFNAGWQIPQTAVAPFGEKDKLFVYLVDRLFASYSLDSITLILALMDPLYPDGDENMLTHLGLANGRAAVMAHEEWTLIRADIDAGRPSPMFIITIKSAWPFDVGVNHQIMAYGYDVHGHEVTLHLYDPNSPLKDDIFLSFNDGDVSNRIVVTHNVDVTEHDEPHAQLPIYCFGRMDYSYVAPKRFTGPRLPGYEVDHRGISVDVGAIRTTRSDFVESGRRMYDVWPDCGEQEFAYEVFAETQELTVTGRPHGYYEPRVEWRVGGVAVTAGIDAELTVAVTLDEDTATTHRVLQVTVVDHALTVADRAADGNFSVQIAVTVREGQNDMDPVQKAADIKQAKTRMTVPSFTGRREQVEGWSEAMSECMRNYLSAHRGGLPDAAAVLAAAYAQLRRPPDPLWDPDPVLIEARDLLATTNPLMPAIAEDIRLDTAQLGAFHVEFDHAVLTPVVVGAHVDHHVFVDVVDHGLTVGEHVGEHVGVDIGEHLEKDLPH